MLDIWTEVLGWLCVLRSTARLDLRLVFKADGGSIER
jgi:hypothetical protein